MIQIEDNGTYEEGDILANLTGKTFDGISILGTDAICIVPHDKRKCKKKK